MFDRKEFSSAIVLISWAVFCGCHRGNLEQAKSTNIEPAQVYSETIQESDVADEMIYPARVVAGREIDVVSEVNGLINPLLVKFGEHVAQNQAMAAVNNPDPASGFHAYQVRAPFAGDIGQVYVQAGDRVQAGQRILRLVDARSLKIQVQVNSEDWPNLAIGSQGDWISTDEQKKFPVKITHLSRVLDGNLGTALCELQFLETVKGPSLLSGTLGRVRFLTHTRRAVLVNQKAIVYKERSPHIILIGDSNKAQYAPIEIVGTHDDKVEIKGSIKIGAKIVGQTSTYIGEGEELKILNDGKS